LTGHFSELYFRNIGVRAHSLRGSVLELMGIKQKKNSLASLSFAYYKFVSRGNKMGQPVGYAFGLAALVTGAFFLRFLYTFGSRDKRYVPGLKLLIGATLTLSRAFPRGHPRSQSLETPINSLAKT
jgi:hypothetical protein